MQILFIEYSTLYKFKDHSKDKKCLDFNKELTEQQLW